MKAKTNVLIALRNILKHNSTRLTPIFTSNGSANQVGDNLEYFIKDMFCDAALQYTYADQKEKEYKKLLSWTGDSSHFPDLIVQGGVGVESKKVNDNSYIYKLGDGIYNYMVFTGGKIYTFSFNNKNIDNLTYVKDIIKTIKIYE